MTRKQALPYVSHILNDSSTYSTHMDNLRDDARLVGWQCGYEPMFVAVQSCIPGVVLDDDEAEEIAIEWLVVRKWFSGEPTKSDYII